MKHARSPQELLRHLSGWVDLVGEVRRSAHGVAALVRIWRYILTVSERLESQQVLRQLAAAVGEDGKEEVVTAADQLREEGRKEGRKEGQRSTLLKLLAAKFGTLPDTVVARVRAASQEQLDQWTVGVLIAPSLAELLGQP